MEQLGVVKLHCKSSQTRQLLFILSPAVVHVLLYTHCEATSYGQSWQRRVLWTTRQHWLHKKITCTAAEAINVHYQTTLPSLQTGGKSRLVWTSMTTSHGIHAQDTWQIFNAADRVMTLANVISSVLQFVYLALQSYTEHTTLHWCINIVSSQCSEDDPPKWIIIFGWIYNPSHRALRITVHIVLGVWARNFQYYFCCIHHPVKWYYKSSQSQCLPSWITETTPTQHWWGQQSYMYHMQSKKSW